MCNRRGRTCLETLGSHRGELATRDRRGWLLAGPFTVASGAEGASGGLSERHLCLLGCLPPSSIPRLSSCVSAKPKLILLFFPRIPCPQESLFLCCFSTSPPRYPCRCFGSEGRAHPMEVPTCSGHLAPMLSHVPSLKLWLGCPSLLGCFLGLAKKVPSPPHTPSPTLRFTMRPQTEIQTLLGLCVLEHKAMGT